MANNDISIRIQTLLTGDANVKGYVDSIDAGFKRGKLAVEAFNAAAGNGEKIFHGLSAGVKDLVKAYLSIEAAKAAFTGMIDILESAEKAQFGLTMSIQAANRELRDVGSLEQWESRIKSLSEQLIIYSETALKQATADTIAQTKSWGASAEQIEEIIRRTGDLSAGAYDFNQSTKDVTAALRGEAEAVEKLGLSLGETYVKAWYEANGAHEKAWKDLTELEKWQVRYQVFLEQTNSSQGRAAESAKTFGGALQLVQTAIENAVTNNQDLARAMSDVAQFIRENADSIGEFAAELITLTARVVQFAIEWKEVIAGFLAIYTITKSVSLLTSVISGLSAAMAVLKATRGATALVEFATASNAALVAGVPFATWLRGGLAVAAAMAAIEIWKVIDAYIQMKHWEGVAKEASQERIEVENKANEKAKEVGKQLGVNIGSLADFNRLVKEGKIVWDQQTATWKRATEEMKSQAKATELTEDQLKQLEGTLKEVSSAYNALETKVSSYYDFAAEKAKTLATSERQATLQVLEIQRQKTEQLLQIAQQEARQKEQIISQSGAGEKQAAEQLKQVAVDLKNAKVKALQDWQQKLQASLTQALGEEKKYAAEVKKLREDLAAAQQSTDDKLRELARRTMSEEEQWNDKKLQAQETLKKAEEALWKGTEDGAKQAQELARQAQEQFAGLAGEVKNGEEVIQTEAETTRAAMDGVKAAGDLINQSIEKQISLTERNRAQWADTAREMQASLDDVAKKIDTINSTPINPKAELQVDSSEVDTKIGELNSTVTHSTHIIHVQTVEENRYGGMIGRFADGGWTRRAGQLPGWGGGDKIKSLLEAGEYVIRKEAVAKYGAGFFDMLNAMRLDLGRLFSSAAASLPEVPRVAFATGGMVGGPSETMVLRLQAGNVELPVLVPGQSPRQMVKAFARELSKMRLTQGR